MSELETKVEDKKSRQRGATLLWVAGMLVALLGASAFATDLGWLYLNTSRLQKAADAAALAGVVNLPGFMTQANTDAGNAASANGFPIGGSNTMTLTALNDNRLRVQLTTQVNTFFLRVLGMTQFTVSRTSTAEYIKPVPMGSPSACFGVGNASILPSSLSHCSAYTQNFWAAINGRYTAKEQGDPFSPACVTINTGGGCTVGPNTQHRTTGYWYAVEIPSGKTSFTVRVYDPGFYRRSTPQTDTGDCCDSGSLSVTGGPRTIYTLRNVDNTPTDPTDNPIISGCTMSYDPVTSTSFTGGGKNQWITLCTVNNPTPGMYVLNVNVENNQGGNNAYAVGVSVSPSSGAQGRVYGINDMSIFTNGNSGTASVYLAEIAPVHAGKKLELRFFDPGENPGGTAAYIGVRMPNGTQPNCNWTAENESGAQTGGGTGACRILTTSSGVALYNGQWITAIIDIPSNYTCSSDCFWKMELDLNGSQDRTTWTARVIGNPVRLVNG
jgi:Flp pilus assembly protein TadG